MHYNRYNYMRYYYSDYSSAGHYYDTPQSFFAWKKWYYFGISVDYTKGQYESYIYDDVNLKYSGNKKVTPNRGYGFYKDTAFIFIGGDWWYADFNGKLKDIRFYY
mgnify:CR=1 FL=1